MQSIDQDHVEQLLAFLRDADEKNDRDRWVMSLSKRKLEESRFHDWSRDPVLEAPDRSEDWEAEHSNKKFYDTAQGSFDYSRNWMEQHVPGKIFLDYCCGAGGNALHAAELGATLAIGIDISPVSIERCRQLAADRDLVKNTYFMVGDCENTGLPSNCVDSIICMGCLHHLDLSYAFPELRRILKPGGRIHVMEALAYNPIIRLYRKLTPSLRTSWEKGHILSLREVKFARHFFEVQNLRYFHLTSILTTPLRKAPAFQSVLKLANLIDRIILKVPPISFLAWTFSFELVKRTEN